MAKSKGKKIINNNEQDSPGLGIDIPGKPREVQDKMNFDYSKTELFFVTNDENLKQIIICGQIKTKEAYEKYYRDICVLTPGMLPLFVNKIPSDIISCCKEQNDIGVAILKLNLTLQELKEFTKGYIDESGNKHEGAFKENSDAQVIFIDKVLSINRVKIVYFQNDEIMRRFKNYKGTLQNFNIDSLKYDIKSKMFSDKVLPGMLDSLKTLGIETVIPFERYRDVNSKVACLSYMTTHLPDIDDSRKLLDAISNNKVDPFNLSMSLLPKEILAIPTWIRGDKQEGSERDAQWTIMILSFLSEIDSSQGLSSGMLKELQDKFEDIKNEDVKKKLNGRIEQIAGIMANSRAPDELFKDNIFKSHVLRGFLLLMLYHDALDDPNLTECNKKSWGISQEDILFREIFYAVWKGWTKLESRSEDKNVISQIYDFQEFLFNGISLVEPESFTFKSMGKTGLWLEKILLTEKWDKRIRNYAISVAKNSNLQCLHYKISASRESMKKLSIDESNVSVELQGNITIEERIDEQKFKALIGNKEFVLSDKDINDFDKISR